MRVAIIGSNDGYDALYIDGQLVMSNHGISVGQVFEQMLERQEQIFKDAIDHDKSFKELVDGLTLDLDWGYLDDEWQNAHIEEVGSFPDWEKDLEKPW